jgi:uncharacterized membrane protein
MVPPGSFANAVGVANLVDHESTWETFPLYARVVYTIGDAQCHQLWYRSFSLNGNQLPIDARMTSMYVFANLGLVAVMFARPSTSTGRVILNSLPAFVRRRLESVGVERGAALLMIGGMVPTAIDGFTQLFKVGGYESTNAMRVLTGAPLGYVGGLLLGAMLVTIRQFTAEMEEMRGRLGFGSIRAPP